MNNTVSFIINNALPFLENAYNALTTSDSQSDHSSDQSTNLAPYAVIAGVAALALTCMARKSKRTSKPIDPPPVEQGQLAVDVDDQMPSNPDRVAAAAILEKLKFIKVTDTSFKGVPDDNKYVSKEQCDQASMAYVAMIGQMMVNKKKFGQNLEDLQALGESTIKKKAGTCDQCAAAVLAEIAKVEGWSSKVEWITTSGTKGINGGHSFLVIGRDDGSILSKPETWGDQAFMMDLWYQNLHHVSGLIDEGPEQHRIMTGYGKNVTVLNSWTPKDFQ